MRGRYLGPAALIGPHGRSGWWVRFGGMAYLCAAEHLRGVTPDEADCSGLDERRQLDELLRAAREVPESYEDLTSQSGPSPPVEVPTEPPREPEEPSRVDLVIGMDAVEQMTPLEGEGETASSTEIRGEGTWSEYWTAGSGRNPLRGKGWKSSVPKRLVWRTPLKTNRRNLGKTGRSWGHTHDKKSRGTQLIHSKFYSGQTSVRSLNIISSTARGRCSLVPRSRTCSMGRVGDTRISQNSFTS